MHQMILKLFVLTACTLLLVSCASHANLVSQTTFAPVKRNVEKVRKCTFEQRLNDANRPVRGIIEGNGSFLTPYWELYVVDIDTEKLSKIESTWAFEGGKMIIKPPKTETVDLEPREVRALATLANSVWADPTDTPSRSMTDVAWNIDLVDGSKKKCESGLGEAGGDGGVLTNAIYTIWKSHQIPKK